MSHFSVMVIGDDPGYQLSPFHEFECTGHDDEFVQEVDETAREREDFEKAIQRQVRLADGRIVDLYDDACYREPTPEEQEKIGVSFGSGIAAGIVYRTQDSRTEVHALPEGAVELSEPYPSFRTYLEAEYDEKLFVPAGEQPDRKGKHKYRYVLLDERGEVAKVVRRTNPNAKWDWWQLGGRFSSRLLLKNGLRDNTALKGDIDFEGMRRLAGERAAGQYDRFQALVAGRDWKSWSELREASPNDLERVRQLYREQPVIRDLWESEEFGPFTETELYKLPREQFVERARNLAVTGFAVVLNRTWYERGEMGWWGCVSNEKDEGEWIAKVKELLDGLSDTVRISFVDCHI